MPISQLSERSGERYLPIHIKSIFVVFIILTVAFCDLSAQPACEIIDYKTSVSMSGSDLVTEKHFMIKVNNPAGTWITDITLTYQKGEKLEILYGRIYDSRGALVRKLKKEEIEKANDISYSTFYQDILKKEFSLHWNEYPYLVELCYRETEDKYIYLSRWSPYYFSGVPVNHASLTLEIPRDISVSFYNPDSLNYHDLSTDKTVIHQWEAKNLQAIKSEYFAVPSYETVPKVTLVPQEFRYGLKGSLESWQSFGLWIDGLIRDLDILPAEEKEKVHKMTDNVTDPREKIKILYHYLQDNTHYVNISIEIGGFKPYPASYVSANKYGDCKALTIFMKALLKEAGIESYFAIINAGENSTRIDKITPGPQFNHVILCVPVDKDTVWLENTAGFIPVGYLGTSTQDRFTLVVNGSNSSLVKTPALSLTDVTNINTYRFSLNESGNGQCMVTKQMRGDDYESFTAYKTYLSDKEMHDRIAESIPFNNFELAAWKFEDHERDEPFITLSCTLNVRGLIRVIGKNLVITPSTDDLPQVEKPAERTRSARIPYPYAVTDTMFFTNAFLNDYSLTLPENIKLESQYGSFELTASKKDKVVCVIRKLCLNKGDFPLENYDAFYSFITSIKDSMKKYHLIYTRKQ